jgi:hypothetical protein
VGTFEVTVPVYIFLKHKAETGLASYPDPRPCEDSYTVILDILSNEHLHDKIWNF